VRSRMDKKLREGLIPELQGEDSSVLRLPVSVCMMAGAEEARIGHALHSVVGWVSEIIVVVSEGVQDSTESIAVSYGARVFREPWKGFIGQFNSAREKCTQEWVLGLDCDEVVSEEMRSSIMRALSGEKDWNCPDAFSFNRRTWFFGKWILHGDWYPDRQTRLFRRTKGAWGGLEPHPKLELRGTRGHLRGDILHYSHRSLADYLNKVQLFTNRFVASNEAPPTPQIWARSVWRFVRAYILRFGFLDGGVGFYLAVSHAFFTAHRHWSLLETLHEGGERNPLFGRSLSSLAADSGNHSREP
jgi:glycosyltransferase involved in cell wall biosynthesis